LLHQVIWGQPNKQLLESHLSKWPSELKQNGTQVKHQFLALFSRPFMWRVILFAVSVCFKNHKMEAFHWLLKASGSERVVFEANTQKKRDQST